MDAVDKLRVECLVIAQTFETFWAYYLQSSGALFDSQCRESAKQFLESLEQLYRVDPRVKEPQPLRLGESDVGEILETLRAWAQGDSLYPYEEPFKSRFMIHAVIAGVKRLLFEDLGLKRWPPSLMSSVEMDYTRDVLRWKGHLPRRALLRNPSEVVRQASEATSIVVVGDIRRSQDLMTYAESSGDFSERMVQFVARIRELLEESAGFFDKFTGDGFLAYFSETVCQSAGLDPIDCFVRFVTRAQDFSKVHFAEWCRHVRKVPDVRVGLALGADLGRVEFYDLQNHLVAVGEPIVWASRMASAASANEILVNNLLWNRLAKHKDLSGEERPHQTKAGEPFLARRIVSAWSDDSIP